MTVGQLLSSTSSMELTRWMAYKQIKDEEHEKAMKKAKGEDEGTLTAKIKGAFGGKKKD